MSDFQRLFRSFEQRPSGPIIDVHVHLGPSDTGEIFYPHLSGDEYAEIMSCAPIDRAYAFAPQRHDGYATANQALADWCDRQGGRIQAFARLGGSYQPMTRAAPWMLRRKLARYVLGRAPDLADLGTLSRYAGVKMLPQLDGLPDDKTFEAIADLRLPVLVHGGTHSPPDFIRRAILPRVSGPVVIAHCGCFPCDDRAFFEALAIARAEPRVYLDTSGVAVSAFLRRAAEEVPDKLLFGSDAPLNHPLVAWHHLASVVHDDGLLARIGYENAAALFGR